jgi:hypothetical protein
MQQLGVLGEYSWNNLSEGPEAAQPATMVRTQANVPPPEGEALLDTLFAAVPAPRDTTDVATGSGFEATEITAGDTLAHGGGCACGVCAMPGYDDAQLLDLAGMELMAGPEGAVIDASVTQSAVPTGGAGIAFGDTFKLHSNPGSKLTVFLDFDGHTTTGTAWNSYWGNNSFYSSAFSTDSSEAFVSTELLRIQQIWARVAEYFSPFNVNVTTQDPGVDALRYIGTSDQAYGIRVVLTDEGGKNFGGIAYKNSFMWSVDTPVFVYANRLADNVKSIADAAAHEIGHAMGLNHDGRGGSEYYYGHGSGATDWAPIMGVGYNANIVQWSKGDYSSATNTEDDLNIITTRNGAVTYRADDHGNTFGTASALGGTVAGGVATVETFGVISGSGARNDVDMFSFQIGGSGAIDLTVSAWTRAFVAGSNTPVYTASPFSMLDVALTLYNASFQEVAAWNDTARIDGVLKLSGLASGTYFLALDGVGIGNPLATTPTGYTEYGSLGQYMIRGTYSVADATGSGGSGDTSGSGTGDASGGTPPGEPVSPGGTKSLILDRTTLTTTEGGTASFTLRAAGATGDVLVALSGLEATEGSLGASQVLLNAANDWTAVVAVAGLEDRDVDGSIAYSLQLAAEGFATQTVQVTNADNDIAADARATASGSWSKRPTNSNNTLSAQSNDDGKTTLWSEGTFSNGQVGIDLRWKFSNLTAGDKLVQVDAWSAAELLRFEYSLDNASTWRLFDGATDGRLAWNGDLLATGVGSTLWVRLIDTVRTDTVSDRLWVDLVSVTAAPTRSDSGDAGGDSDAGGGGSGGGGSGGGGSGGGGAGGASLVLDRTALAVSEGGAASFTLSATDAAADVRVSITGLDITEGRLAASEVLLNAANNWSATIEVFGVEDRDVDGDVPYTLQFTAEGFAAQSLVVTGADNDVAPDARASAAGTYATRPANSNHSLSATSADDGGATMWAEGRYADGTAGIELRWQFTGLSAGNKLVQVDAWSANEELRFEYSADNAATWQRFDGAPDAALAWNGDLLATGVGSNLWVRLIDTVRTDTTVDRLWVDLVSVTAAPDLVFG